MSSEPCARWWGWRHKWDTWKTIQEKTLCEDYYTLYSKYSQPRYFSIVQSRQCEICGLKELRTTRHEL